MARNHRSLVSKLVALAFSLGALFGSAPLAWASPIPADHVPVFFPQGWSPQEADAFITGVMEGDSSKIVQLGKRQAVLVPKDRTFVRWIAEGEPTGLRPSWYVSQQFHGQGKAPVPAWIAHDPSLAKLGVPNQAAYFASENMQGHITFGFRTTMQRGRPELLKRTAGELLEMANILEIDQESVLAYMESGPQYEQLRLPGEFSIVAMDHGQAIDPSIKFPDDPGGTLKPTGKPYIPKHMRGWRGAWRNATLTARRIGAFTGAAARRVGIVANSAGRTALQAARFAAYNEIGSGVFARAAANSANWTLRARFGFGVARFGASLVGGMALGYAVDKGVTRMTGSQDLGFVAGYAAGAYGGYATESVLFGRVAGSVAARASLYLLPLAVHMHIMSVHINAPLEEAMQQGDEEAARLYARFNWGFGLGALGYGVETYARAVGGWFGL